MYKGREMVVDSEDQANTRVTLFFLLLLCEYGSHFA